jgi:hypothetical protein
MWQIAAPWYRILLLFMLEEYFEIHGCTILGASFAIR